MNLYKSIDKYLLQNYPAIWSTRVHVFAPIGIMIILIVFLFNAFLLGYNPKNDLPESEGSVILMIIPALTFIVIWFVMQAKYNVTKAGGRLNVAQEYLSYLIYFLMFLIGFLLITIVPLSNDYKIGKSVSEEERLKDLEVLNLGNGVVNRNNTLSVVGNVFSYNKVSFYDNSSVDYYSETNIGNKVTVSKTELKKIIDNYILAYNKYSKSAILMSADEVIRANMNGEINILNNESYWYWDDNAGSKIAKIGRVHERGLDEYLNTDALNVLGVFLAYFSLLVWVFKQIHWKQYVFGLVSLALTPVVIGIIAVVFFELFRFDEEVGFILVILAYFVVGGIVIGGLAKSEKSNLSMVLAMYLQVFLPVLPFFIWGLFDHHFRNDDIEALLYVSWMIGLLSIAAFKFIYKRFELLPLRK